ncbi:MAG: hypothetical protein MUE68_07810 [Bacteroidetes bacterium]|nr:hypothetical protein [Bacteroidota bacterium]
METVHETFGKVVLCDARILLAMVFFTLFPGNGGGCGFTEVEPPPLSAPSYVGITSVSPSTIRIHWQGYSEATGYRIDRSVDGGKLAPVVTVQASPWTDGTLSEVSRYSYRINSLRGSYDVNSDSPVFTVVYQLSNPVIRTLSLVSGNAGSMHMALDASGVLFATRDNNAAEIRILRTSDWSLHSVVTTETVGTLRCFAFSPDATTMLLGGRHGVAVVRLSDGSLLRTIRMDSASVREIVPIPGGDQAAILSVKGRLQVWNIANGSLVANIDTLQPTIPRSTAVSPNGRLLASCWGYGIIVWDLAAGNVVFMSYGAMASPLFSRDGSILSVGLPPKRLNLSTTTWTTINEFPAGWESGMTAFGPDGTSQLVAESNFIHVVHLPDGRIERTLSEHERSVVFLGYLSDGSVMSLDEGNAVKIWSDEMEYGWTIIR